MLRIPAADGKTYKVPSWTTFKAWVVRFSLLFVILGTGFSIGLYFFGISANQNIKNQINHYSTNNCLASIKSNSILNKYNDFINGVLETRKESRDHNLASGDFKSAAIDQKAINRYNNDRAPIPTEDQCRVKILK